MINGPQHINNYVCMFVEYSAWNWQSLLHSCQLSNVKPCPHTTPLSDYFDMVHVPVLCLPESCILLQTIDT